MKGKKKLLELTVEAGEEVTDLKHTFATSNGFERLAAVVLAIEYLEKLKKEFIG